MTMAYFMQSGGGVWVAAAVLMIWQATREILKK